MLIKPEKDILMRSAIFASIVVASGVFSFGASACDGPEAYKQNINRLLEKYQTEITQANNAFAHANVPVVRVVYTDRRHSPVEYLGNYPYPNSYVDAAERWREAADAAASNYSRDAKAAYDNLCHLWWW
jgi:hypothetical protein